jgi:iron complex outermembrane receptor protein
MKRMPKLSPTLSAAAALLCCLQAQAQEQATTQLQRVEVTGSNIKRLASETASPVQVITRNEIRQTGATTVREVLDTLTAATPTELKDNGNNASFAAGASGFSMRGLGKGATLVLLNGRRAAYYALADGAKEMFVNVDSIPADAIERIETLKDGASAIYGSDAMAGVINIITRREYQGVGITASHIFNERPNAGDASTASITAGYGDLSKDRFNVFANLEAYKREGYMLSEVKGDYAEWHKRIYSPSFGDPSINSFPGNLQVGSTRRPVAGCSSFNSAGLCVTDLNDINQVSDPAKRLNFFGGARLQVNDSLQLFTEASYSKTESQYLGLPFAMAAGSPFRWYDGYNKKAQEVAAPVLAANNPANSMGVPAGINYRFMDNAANMASTANANQYRVLVGAQGVFHELDWEVALGRMAAEADKLDRVRPHRDMVSAVSSGEYKIGQTNSPELLARLFPVAGVEGKNHQNFIDAKLSGELFKLPAGALAFALGAEHRQERVNIRSTDNIMKAEIIGRGAQLTVGERKLSAAFLELNAPVVKGLEVNGALRFDKASGFSGRVSPKLGMRWEVTPQLMLRGTVAGGFRAPNIPETLGQVGVTGFFNSMVDPRRCEAATQIRDILAKGNAADKSDATTAYNSGCLASLPTMISANPNLKPETSSSFTLGFVLEPSRNLTMALDYFKIERKNEISYRDPDYVLEREGKAGYEAAIERGAISEQDLRLAARANELSPGANVAWGAGAITALLLGYENFGKTETSGVDFDVKGRVGNASFGNLTIGLNTTYALSYRAWDVDANQWRPNQIGLRNQPRLRARLATTWNKGPWTTGLRFTYTSATKLNDSEADFATWGEDACKRRLNPGTLNCFIDSDLQTDWNLSYTGFKNVRLMLNVINLMGEESPVNLRSGYTLRPRSYKIGAEYRF